MTYLDTGCLVKLYYPEPDSARVIGLIQGKLLSFSPLHELELVNALQLKIFQGTATQAKASAARALVQTDLDAGILVSPNNDWKDIFPEAIELSQKYTSTTGCRALDILHCAAAKVLKATEFVSTDARQKKVATEMGLNLVTF